VGQATPFEDCFFDEGGGGGGFFGDYAVFAQYFVPGIMLVLFWILVKGNHHSVSAFGSSIGTLIRSSIGAAMFAENVGDGASKSCLVGWDGY